MRRASECGGRAWHVGSPMRAPKCEKGKKGKATGAACWRAVTSTCSGVGVRRARERLPPLRVHQSSPRRAARGGATDAHRTHAPDDLMMMIDDDDDDGDGEEEDELGGLRWRLAP